MVFRLKAIYKALVSVIQDKVSCRCSFFFCIFWIYKTIDMLLGCFFFIFFRKNHRELLEKFKHKTFAHLFAHDTSFIFMLSLTHSKQKNDLFFLVRYGFVRCGVYGYLCCLTTHLSLKQIQDFATPNVYRRLKCRWKKLYGRVILWQQQSQPEFVTLNDTMLQIGFGRRKNKKK